MEHRHPVKVYYEDTDCLGMVYHSNYLKYMERARSELVATFGKSVQDWNREGAFFIVYAVSMRFKRAAGLGDLLEIVTHLSLSSPYRAVFKQRVERAGELIVEAEIELACLDHQRSLREFPHEFQV
jgi:tol-pal system-associated acyl-CoA thioesterase